MGRYDGEYYEEVPACRPGEHEWATNGNCWHCRRNRKDLVAQAERILDLDKKGQFGRHAG
jgi:hypothetical protein